MKPDPKKVEAINQKDIPQTVARVKSFLQTCQYNQTFMFGTTETYIHITAPLRKMLRKNARFEWTKECDNTFGKLKKALVSDKVMAHWCKGRKTELVVDIGPEGLAATLCQEEPETGFWRPINYCSRTQTKAEQRYSQIKGESLAIQFGVLLNQMYLYGNQFVVVTDH